MIATLPRDAAHPDALNRGEGARPDGAPKLFASRGAQAPVHAAPERQSHSLAPLPRLRGDLTISQQATAEGIIFVIKNPLRDQFFRFPEEAYFIASQLDGKTEREAV